MKAVGDDRHLVHGKDSDSEEVVPDWSREAAEVVALEQSVFHSVGRLKCPHVLKKSRGAAVADGWAVQDGKTQLPVSSAVAADEVVPQLLIRVHCSSCSDVDQQRAARLGDDR